MSQYTHSIVLPPTTITAGDIKTFDLPVNPLSHLFITLAFLNNTANTRAAISGLTAALDRVEVLFRGSPIISLNGLDLYMWAMAMLREHPPQDNHINTDNAARSFTWCIPFGRRLFNPAECFPATSRGNLTCTIDFASAFTAFDTPILTVEAVELPGASPQRTLRATTLTGTPTATGDFDVSLPIGNPLLNLLLWGTTVPATTVYTTTIDAIRLLLNNDTRYFTEAKWETLRYYLNRRIAPVVTRERHIHMENINATYLQNQDTDVAEFVNLYDQNHGLADFDPGEDDAFILDTAALASLTLRITAGDTNPLRVIPTELITIPGA